MALVKCRQCGTNMLSDATACPGCGAPMARGLSKKKVLLIVFGGLVTFGTGRLLEVPQVQCFFSEAQAQQAAREFL
jgi:hypothetical protein